MPVPNNIKAAFELAESDEVGCYYCMLEGDRTTYRKGEAYLCDAGHSPYDGNAHYICTRHLDGDAVVVAR